MGSFSFEKQGEISVDDSARISNNIAIPKL
jgi:hypothetical protein